MTHPWRPQRKRAWWQPLTEPPQWQTGPLLSAWRRLLRVSAQERESKGSCLFLRGTWRPLSPSELTTATAGNSGCTTSASGGAPTHTPEEAAPGKATASSGDVQPDQRLVPCLQCWEHTLLKQRGRLCGTAHAPQRDPLPVRCVVQVQGPTGVERAVSSCANPRVKCAGPCAILHQGSFWDAEQICTPSLWLLAALALLRNSDRSEERAS